MLGISPIVFVSLAATSSKSVYIPPTPENHSTISILFSISFAVQTKSLASALFPRTDEQIITIPHLPTAHPNLTESCPGGTTVLKHHPRHLHLRPAQPTARNEPSILQPLLLPNANGISAQIIWPTDRASNTKAATGRSCSRTQQICHFPVTVIGRPETHLFSLKNRYGDGEGSLAGAGSARVSGNFFLDCNRQK